ncbi:MAG: hypothetical protein DRN17_06860 [Thermoplasmata archaeon]|nr:MAG: hypothetical protein DRN17_06860 [Thermoplasmata archaeon]
MKKEKEENMRMQDIRPVDVAEYIYQKLSERKAMDDETREMLETLIVQMKDHTFDRMDKIFGIERE